MKGLSPDTLQRLLAAAAGISPVRLDAALEGVGANRDWSRQAVARLLRVSCGEDAAKVAAEVTFRGRRFLSDHRACLIRGYLSVFVDAILEDWAGRRPRVLEVGCGAGAVITSLALEMEGEFWGTDIAAEAVQLAAENAVALGAKVEFRQRDLLSGLPSDFDVIFANIPYEEAAARLPEEHWEPAVALYDPSGEHLGLIRRLLRQLPAGLSTLYLELPADVDLQRPFAGTPIRTPAGEQVGIKMTLAQARETLHRLEESSP